MNLNNVSQQESCELDLKKQGIFSEVYKEVTNKFRIAVLALVLGSSQQVMAQNSYETDQDYKTFHAQIVERFQKLSPEQHKMFANLYVEGLKEINPENKEIFGNYIKFFMSVAQRKGLAMFAFNDMLKKGILQENSNYTQKLRAEVEKIEAIGQEYINEQRKIQEEQRKIQEEQRKKQEQIRQITKMLEHFKQ